MLFIRNLLISKHGRIQGARDDIVVMRKILFDLLCLFYWFNYVLTFSLLDPWGSPTDNLNITKFKLFIYSVCKRTE